MATTRMLILAAWLLAIVGVAAGGDEDRKLTPAVTDAILEDAPLTLVFRQVNECPRDGVPCLWCWSINSAGQTELTIEISPKLADLTPRKTTRESLKLSADQLHSIRKALREERFFHLKDDYGPNFIHGGWSTLTVVAGHLTKTVRFNSSWSWPTWGERVRPEMLEAAPAMRVWLKLCEAVDSDSKVFEERLKIAQALKALKE